MIEILLGRDVLAEAGRAVFALPGMTEAVAQHGRVEQRALVQVELTPAGGVRVRALASGPVARELEAAAGSVLAKIVGGER